MGKQLKHSCLQPEARQVWQIPIHDHQTPSTWLVGKYCNLFTYFRLSPICEKCCQILTVATITCHSLWRWLKYSIKGRYTHLHIAHSEAIRALQSNLLWTTHALVFRKRNVQAWTTNGHIHKKKNITIMVFDQEIQLLLMCGHFTYHWPEIKVGIYFRKKDRSSLKTNLFEDRN